MVADLLAGQLAEVCVAGDEHGQVQVGQPGIIGGAVSRYIQRTYRREPVVIAIVVDA